MAAVLEGHGEEAMRGATIYVTLEPCSTRGRTPACTEGLLEAGIGRVVYAVADPNPAHAGRADAILAAAGIEVSGGVMEAEGARLIRPFAKRQREGRPWVILKTAMSLDGRLTRPPGEGMWLTGSEARSAVQRLRAECDVIVTSGETVRRDRPRLDLREAGLVDGREQPWRVVLTRRPESLPRDAPLFTDGHRDRTLVRGGGELGEVLERLAGEQAAMGVLLECGGELAGEFVDAGLVDEVVAFLAPMVTGGPVAAVGGGGVAEGVTLDEVRFERFGPDVMMRGVVRS